MGVKTHMGCRYGNGRYGSGLGFCHLPPNLHPWDGTGGIVESCDGQQVLRRKIHCWQMLCTNVNVNKSMMNRKKKIVKWHINAKKSACHPSVKLEEVEDKEASQTFQHPKNPARDSLRYQMAVTMMTMNHQQLHIRVALVRKKELRSPKWATRRKTRMRRKKMRKRRTNPKLRLPRHSWVCATFLHLIHSSFSW